MYQGYRFWSDENSITFPKHEVIIFKNKLRFDLN